ncbi:hypothetical protein [Ruegeria sp. HKCCA5463]|uniref:hypothetical protein n=1 Tax=Ruegeria sp. HKCCA5463 TaxID=2682994 RepID=UPI001489F1A0|nr:hypothetical protein [Ruegeria sp. HKCCA5463]
MRELTLTNRIKGLMHPRAEFLSAVVLLVFVPLIPLGIEWVFKQTLAASTVFLTAALYTISHAFSSQRFWVFLLGVLFVAVLMFCFGHVSAAAQNSAQSTLLDPSTFTYAMYYVSFAVMAFFGYLQARQRWVMHVLELEPFWEFRHYDDNGGGEQR